MNATPYTRAADLEELQRLAWIANDRATLALLELAEDAAGFAAEEVRERRAGLLCDARGVTTMRAELAELQAARNAERAELSRLRDLASWVEHLLAPFTGIRYGRPTGSAIKPAPKWAQSLITAHCRATKRQP